MAAILGIEADHGRRALLQALISDRVDAHVAIVDSAQAAIAYLLVCDVDVIVVPALLPPRDCEQLSSHVRQHAGRHVQMLTIPALDFLREMPSAEKQGPALFGRRRPASTESQSDPLAVRRQIGDRLRHALKMSADERASSVSSAVNREAPSTAPVPPPASSIPSAFSSDRRFAPRMRRDDAPWLWSIRLPWGTDVELVNISTSGLLLESDSKVSPGITLELRLRGPSLNRVVRARFVRCTIARMDHSRVQYYAAAKFEEPFNSPFSRPEMAARTTPLSIAELLTAVLSDSNQTEAASIRFARGLREVLGVRDVLIRRGPIARVEGSDTHSFQVDEDGGSSTVLQVVCEPHRARSAEDVRLMRAAASLAAALLHFERPPEPATRPVLNWKADARPKNESRGVAASSHPNQDQV